MALATATADGAPSVRMVLLRGVDEGDLCFYTGYESRKASELDRNPNAALLFHWQTLGRQVRIEGAVARLRRRSLRRLLREPPARQPAGSLGLPPGDGAATPALSSSENSKPSKSDSPAEIPRARSAGAAIG